MVNSFDDGWSIGAIADLLHRSPVVVRERLTLFGRLPACDPVRAEEDRQLAMVAPGSTVDDVAPGTDVPQVEVVAPGAARTRRGALGRLLDKFLRA